MGYSKNIEKTVNMLLRHRVPLSRMRLIFFSFKLFCLPCSILIARSSSQPAVYRSADASSWITPAESLLLQRLRDV